MDLEQRVKALEYEVKVLKSEIQRTLLDIQEQILVHYYPVLRSEEPAPPEAAVKAAEAWHSKNNGSTPATVIPPVVVPNPADARSANPLEEQPPFVRQVSVAEARARHGETAPKVDEAGQMSKLLEWALNSAAQIGSDRFKALLDACEARKVLPTDLRDLLIRIAPLNRRLAPETVGSREIIQVIMQLDEILGRAADVEEALLLIEEAKLG